MTMLTSNFVLLTALINGVFYVHRPKNAKSIFICFNKMNDSWPENWYQMQMGAIDRGSIPIFFIKLPKNLTKYKIRILYINRTHGDTNWKNFTTTLPPPLLPPKEEEGYQPPLEAFIKLLYYIVFVQTVQLLKLLVKFFLKWNPAEL